MLGQLFKRRRLLEGMIGDCCFSIIELLHSLDVHSSASQRKMKTKKQQAGSDAYQLPVLVVPSSRTVRFNTILTLIAA